VCQLLRKRPAGAQCRARPPNSHASLCLPRRSTPCARWPCGWPSSALRGPPPWRSAPPRQQRRRRRPAVLRPRRCWRRVRLLHRASRQLPAMPPGQRWRGWQRRLGSGPGLAAGKGWRRPCCSMRCDRGGGRTGGLLPCLPTTHAAHQHSGRRACGRPADQGKATAQREQSKATPDNRSKVQLQIQPMRSQRQRRSNERLQGRDRQAPGERRLAPPQGCWQAGFGGASAPAVAGDPDRQVQEGSRR
jgi:hypothetical protein